MQPNRDTLDVNRCSAMLDLHPSTDGIPTWKYLRAGLRLRLSNMPSDNLCSLRSTSLSLCVYVRFLFCLFKYIKTQFLALERLLEKQQRASASTTILMSVSSRRDFLYESDTCAISAADGITRVKYENGAAYCCTSFCSSTCVIWNSHVQDVNNATCW